MASWVDELSDEEVEARLDAMKLDSYRAGALDRRLDSYRRGGSGWPVSDRIAGLTEAFRITALGGRPPADAHPVALEALQRGPVGPLTLAKGIASALGRPLTRGTSAEISALAATVPQFPEAIADAARRLLLERPSGVLNDILAITFPAQVANYHAVTLGTLDIATEMPTPTRSSGTYWHAIVPRMAAEAVAIASTPSKLIVSEQTLFNDDINFIPSAVTAYGSATARAEARRVAELLEGNVLPSGAPIFDAANSNVGVGALTEGGLAVGFATLRQQPTEAGQASGLACSSIVIHPDDEVSVLKLVETLPPARQPRVVVNPFLVDNAAWYFLADQLQAPGLARLTLIGGDPSAISITTAPTAAWVDGAGRHHSIPGISLELVHSCAIQAISPIGLVKLTKT